MRTRVVEYLNKVFETEIFDYLVPYPAFIYALLMVLVMWLFVKRCQYADLSPRIALKASLLAMVGGIAGARLFFLAVYYHMYDNFFEELLKINEATISWGAYLGGFLSLIVFFSVAKQPVPRYLDVIGSIMGIGPFIGRWSCFLHGCDFGKVTGLPWGISYPHGSIPFVKQVNDGILDPMAEYTLPVHPLPIYFSINGLLLFIVFTYLWKKRNYPNGAIFLGYWLAYSVIRFFLEFLRGDTQVFYCGIFSIGQVMTMIVFIISLGCLVIVFRRKPLITSV